MIYLDQVSVRYRKGDIGLSGVSLSIGRGEFVSVVGHSGAGKTSLLKLILGETQPTRGKVFFDSVDIETIPSRKMNEFRRRIGTVFQDFRLLPGKTVYENVAFAMEAAGKADAKIKKDVPYVLKLVGLEEKADRFPTDLSGGQKQRVAIARAIINQPDLIIADEPTGNLDSVNTAEVVAILKKINELGTTVIVTTHDREVIETVGGRLVVMEDGQIIKDELVEQESPKEPKSEPEPVPDLEEDPAAGDEEDEQDSD